MINPNGDDFRENGPAISPQGERIGERGVSGVASSAWEQTKQSASSARERTEFFLRENPVPTVLGALVLGLAIGLAIRYASEDREPEVKTPAADLDLGWLSLPFLWPFVKNVRRRAEDAADSAKDYAKDGIDRLKKIDVDDYVKPLRKRWKSWTH